ncbi:iron dicitrate transport regulator FecR [Pararhizobium antarcticum]|uniref:Iron dicitrate transport regulator FecR n=2 Tax=Pararhizobium antarcticum TaxID=1798805 RepID=A0A657LLW8_9HYPH|nr:iron dicitrate transport regulator FecR [Pararhizobium antarcticum]
MPARRGLIGRRLFMAGCSFAAVALAGVSTRANTVIGKANDIRGKVDRKQAELQEGLAAGGSILDNDTVLTGAESFADLQLGGDTRILLGSETELLVDSFIAGQGGTLELGMGQMVFDRPEGLPKIDLALRTTFGMIGVRGTKFFCGHNRGVFAVFVEHGLVSVDGGGVTKMVAAGQGVDIANPGDAPKDPVVWGAARIAEAYASVGIRP